MLHATDSSKGLESTWQTCVKWMERISLIRFFLWAGKQFVDQVDGKDLTDVSVTIDWRDVNNLDDEENVLRTATKWMEKIPSV